MSVAVGVAVADTLGMEVGTVAGAVVAAGTAAGWVVGTSAAAVGGRGAAVHAWKAWPADVIGVSAVVVGAPVVAAAGDPIVAGSDGSMHLAAGSHLQRGYAAVLV